MISSRYYSTIMTFMAVFVVLWLNGGMCDYILPYIPPVARYGVYIIWLILAYVGSSSFRSKIGVPLFYFSVFYVVILISIVIANRNDFNMTLMRAFIYIFMITTIYFYYAMPGSIEERKIIIISLAIDYLFIAINTCIKLTQYPSLSRYAATGKLEEIMHLQGVNLPSITGVGSYGYFYGIVAVILILLYYMLNYKKYRYIALFAYLFALYSLFKAGFVMAMLFAFIMSFIIIDRKISTTVRPVMNILFVLIILIFIFSGSISNLLYKSSQIEGLSYDTSLRMNEIGDFLSGDISNTSDIGGRIELYTRSIRAFINNPLYGAIGKNVTDVIGGHASWLDYLGFFGVLSIPYWIFLKLVYTNMKKEIASNQKFIFIVCWCYFILLGFVNSNGYAPIYIAWFIITPFSINLLPAKSVTSQCN